MDLFDLKRLVLAAGAAGTVSIFLKSAGTAAALLHAPDLLLLAWSLAPIGHLWAFGRADDPPTTRLILASVAVMAVAFGTWVYLDLVVVRADPQGAVAFLVVPVMQLGVILPAILAGWILRRREQATAAFG